MTVYGVTETNLIFFSAMGNYLGQSKGDRNGEVTTNKCFTVITYYYSGSITDLVVTLCIKICGWTSRTLLT